MIEGGNKQLFRILLSEYENYIGKRKCEFLFALICYYRMPKFRILVLIRLMISTNCSLLKEWISNKLMIKYGMEIATNIHIGRNLKIEHFNGIVFGLGVKIGNNCTIYQQVTLGQKNGEYPTIGNNVTIYPGARVIGGITIGDNAIIAPNSVVLHNVSEGEVVAGIPAKAIK